MSDEPTTPRTVAAKQLAELKENFENYDGDIEAIKELKKQFCSKRVDLQTKDELKTRKNRTECKAPKTRDERGRCIGCTYGFYYSKPKEDGTPGTKRCKSKEMHQAEEKKSSRQTMIENFETYVFEYLLDTKKWNNVVKSSEVSSSKYSNKSRCIFLGMDILDMGGGSEGKMAFLNSNPKITITTSEYQGFNSSKENGQTRFFGRIECIVPNKYTYTYYGYLFKQSG